MPNEFLPVCKEDMEKRGWDILDFIIISGDAYVDHPSFGHAIIARLLEVYGYKVGIIPQPDWKSTADFMVLGKPRLGFLITAGNIDSMVNHYTASKRIRNSDSYSPGGKTGYRPDRATIVYTNRVKEAYKDVPVILGGIEASLRRFAHYDYWDDKVRRSILADSKADLLIYGMGEKQIIELAEALDSGLPIDEITYLDGTAFITNTLDKVYDYKIIPGFEDVESDKKVYAQAFMEQYLEQDGIRGRRLVQPHADLFLVQNPPAAPLNQSELDRVYSLPYQRNYHPIYSQLGGVPAIEEVKFSLTSVRGCFGNCSFCALAFHQGRIVQGRSHESIIQEAGGMVHDPDFKGYIHDVGGPTANFRQAACERQLREGTCRGKQCLFPQPCRNLVVDHSDYLILLRKLRAIPGVKKVFIRSGIRYDYLMADTDDSLFREIVEHHISGQLKVAPEHVSPRVLDKMGKPGRDVYDDFVEKYFELNRDLNKNQYLIPYLISSHPGSDLKAAIELAEYLRDFGFQPEQVQDFYPTPGTLSTCMFYTGLDPRTMEKVYVPRDPKEKAMQRALLHYRRPENYRLVYQALMKANRKDLVGYGKHCLIPPRKSDKLRKDEASAKGGKRREKKRYPR
jgi:uncharacterized radical SAM protein YgiQ